MVQGLHCIAREKDFTWSFIQRTWLRDTWPLSLHVPCSAAWEAGAALTSGRCSGLSAMVQLFPSCVRHPWGSSWLESSSRTCQRGSQWRWKRGIPCHSQAALPQPPGIHSDFLCFFNLTLTSLTDGERWLNRGSLQKFVLWCLQTVSVRSICCSVNTAVAGCLVPSQQLILLSWGPTTWATVEGQVCVGKPTPISPEAEGLNMRPSLLHRKHRAALTGRPDWTPH